MICNQLFLTILYTISVTGKGFSNEENFGQFPLQVNGFRDIHESLEAAMAHKEIETISSEATQKSGQEVCIVYTNGVARTLIKLCTSKGDYWIKQQFFSIVSLFGMGTSLKGKNLLPEGVNSCL